MREIVSSTHPSRHPGGNWGGGGGEKIKKKNPKKKKKKKKTQKNRKLCVSFLESELQEASAVSFRHVKSEPCLHLQPRAFFRSGISVSGIDLPEC